MDRPAVRRLRDLLAATEAIRDDQGIGGRATNAREQYVLSHFHGNIVVSTFVSERPRHAATTRIKKIGIHSHCAEDILGFLHAVSAFR